MFEVSAGQWQQLSQAQAQGFELRLKAFLQAQAGDAVAPAQVDEAVQRALALAPAVGAQSERHLARLALLVLALLGLPAEATAQRQAAVAALRQDGTVQERLTAAARALGVGPA